MNLIETTNSVFLKNYIIKSVSLLTGMSHEMRTHMNSIIAFSRLKEDYPISDEESREFGEQVLISCNQLLRLLDSFFDLALVYSGSSTPVTLKLHKLDSLLDGIGSEFKELIRTEGHSDLALIIENSTDNTSEILIDDSKLFKIISVLFQNALNNTYSGYIKIGCESIGDRLTFYVLDTGQNYEKCKEFLRNDNIDESLTRFYDTCSAVNIALAKKLIELLGGILWIKHNETNGIGMYFSIPQNTIGR